MASESEVGEPIVEVGPFCEWDLCLAPFAGPPRSGCGSPYLHANGTWIGPAPVAEPVCVDGDHHPSDPRPANGYEPAPHADAKIDRVSTLRGSILPPPFDAARSLLVSVSPDAFAALPRLSHAEIQAALDKGRAEAFPGHHPLAAAPREPSAPTVTLTQRGWTTAPTDGAELAELLPLLPAKIQFVLHGTATDIEIAETAERDCARALELLLVERERRDINDAMNGRALVRAAEERSAAQNEAAALSARVVELEAEVAKERAAFTGANTAWSRAVVLQEQAQDERAAAIVRAEEGERK